MIRIDARNRRPHGRFRILLNGREVKDVVALFALWNGGPGYVEVFTRIAGLMVIDAMRQTVCTQPRFGLVRVERDEH